MKQPIDQEVEKTMDVLNHLQRVPANPYLMTRLNARLQEVSGSIPKRSFNWAWGLAALLLALNLFGFLQQQGLLQKNEGVLEEVIGLDYALEMPFEAHFID